MKKVIIVIGAAVGGYLIYDWYNKRQKNNAAKALAAKTAFENATKPATVEDEAKPAELPLGEPVTFDDVVKALDVIKASKQPPVGRPSATYIQEQKAAVDAAVAYVLKAKLQGFDFSKIPNIADYEAMYADGLIRTRTSGVALNSLHADGLIRTRTASNDGLIRTFNASGDTSNESLIRQSNAKKIAQSQGQVM